MKLILTREVAGLGGAGDVVTVKDGYGRNFLLARGSAILWTKGGEGQIEIVSQAKADVLTLVERKRNKFLRQNSLLLGKPRKAVVGRTVV